MTAARHRNGGIAQRSAHVALRAQMSSTNKSVLDQVREIKKLLEDADETLAQARWAMTTLEFRLTQEAGAPPAEE
jgi:hypothetical protein